MIGRLTKLAFDLSGGIRAAVIRFGLRDKWLLVAVVLGILCGAQGMGWGRYDCLNLDSMAFRTIFAGDRPPGHPGTFLKPPFYTYINHIAARLPAQAISGAIIWGGGKVRDDLYFRLRLFMGRAVNLAMFAASVVMIFALVHSFYGLAAARAAALIFASSAGFVVYQVYLTTDLALVFMMIAAFACAAAIARQPTMGISIAAGLLAGLATATKYNGLAVAAALPVAHLLASRGNPIAACLKRPAAWACGAAVPLGFLIGNPYALFDWPKFSSDFLYNYKVTPVYGGITEGTGYGRFFAAFADIYGIPGTILLVLGTLLGVVFVISQFRRGDAWKLWLLAVAVFVVYSWKIGSFPRMQTRFVLPMAPFLLLLAAAGFSWLFRSKWFTGPVLGLLLIYNLISCFWVGELFRHDPRMELIPVVQEKICGKSVVEISKSIPLIAKLPDRDLKTIEMPSAIRRGEIFDQIFADQEDMQQFRDRWTKKDGVEWFTPENRAKRKTDWIIWCSNDVESVTRPQYDALFLPGSGFQVVFDKHSPERPAWVYPREPEFIRNRTTIWKKDA